MSHAARQARAARTLLAGLHHAGVRHVVISPGARSMPLALAARRVPGLDVVVVRDERAAAFFALGAARSSGLPALVISTSGSAVAHWHPALVEADAARIPLIALSADRPPERRARRAPQTIDQLDLFGSRVRLRLELGALADPGLPDEALGSSARVAVRAAVGPPAGPVHLNACLRKPLEPPVPDVLADEPVQPPGPPPVPPRVLPAAGPVEMLARRLAASRRPLIVSGPEAPFRAPCPAALAELLRAAGAVGLCEAGALEGRPEGFPIVDSFEPLVRSPRARGLLAPDLVIQVGPPPVSAGLTAWLEGPQAPPRIVIAPEGVPDPWHAAEILPADPLEGLRALIDAASPSFRPAPDWPDRWRRAHDALREARALAGLDEPAPGGELTESAVLRRVIERLAPGRHALLANSLPIREVELFTAGLAETRSVITQRGASGIDGLIAGAAGAARSTGAPVLALLGDMAATHDLTSLLVLRDLGLPVIVVVIDNAGGRIFEQLPLAEAGLQPEEFEELFATPPGLDFAAAGATCGIPALRVRDEAGLTAALDRADRAGGPFLLAVAVEPGSSARAVRRLVAAVDAAVQALDAD